MVASPVREADVPQAEGPVGGEGDRPSMAHAARIVVMNRGSVVTVGKPVEVRENTEVKRIYLGGTLEAVS